METSLITMVASAPTQSDAGGLKSEHCSNGFSRSSSLVVSCICSLLLVFFSFVMMVSIISFMMPSDDFKSSDGLSGFFFRLYFLPIFQREHLIVLIVSNMSLPELICCEARNDKAPIGNVLLVFLLSHNFFDY